ncbi:hypothetical protein TNCV_892021 [Trichonephila clavipes]|nr:hypothetical protein TNCV_892021 [Trichonephila clavipes]
MHLKISHHYSQRCDEWRQILSSEDYGGKLFSSSFDNECLIGSQPTIPLSVNNTEQKPIENNGWNILIHYKKKATYLKIALKNEDPALNLSTISKLLPDSGPKCKYKAWKWLNSST